MLTFCPFTCHLPVKVLKKGKNRASYLADSFFLRTFAARETTGRLLFRAAVGADGKLEVHGMDKLVNTEHICETI